MSTIRKKVECFGVMKVSDASEQVIITRDLTLDDNSPGASDDWDPMLNVDLYPIRSELHPNDRTPEGGNLEHVRASELRKLADCLNAAISMAEILSVIPPQLTDEEWRTRYGEAEGIGPVAREVAHA